MTQRSRGFCFTLNNYSQEDIECMRSVAKDCCYCIFGYEKGESETPHLQGYLYFKNARSWKNTVKLCEKWHLECAKGKPYDNFIYCSKGDNFEEFGERPRGAGKRSDIDTACEIVTGKL